jgi:hypothetical protein
VIAFVRQVRDDFTAMRLLNAMLSVGAEPISVVFRPTLTDGVTGAPFQAALPFVVFGKAADAEALDAIDEAYDRLLGE